MSNMRSARQAAHTAGASAHPRHAQQSPQRTHGTARNTNQPAAQRLACVASARRCVGVLAALARFERVLIERGARLLRRAIRAPLPARRTRDALHVNRSSIARAARHASARRSLPRSIARRGLRRSVRTCGRYRTRTLHARTAQRLLAARRHARATRLALCRAARLLSRLTRRFRSRDRRALRRCGIGCLLTQRIARRSEAAARRRSSLLRLPTRLGTHGRLVDTARNHVLLGCGTARRTTAAHTRRSTGCLGGACLGGRVKRRSPTAPRCSPAATVTVRRALRLARRAISLTRRACATLLQILRSSPTSLSSPASRIGARRATHVSLGNTLRMPLLRLSRRWRHRSRRLRPTRRVTLARAPRTVAARYVAAPDDHLHLGDLPPLGLQTIDHAAHAAIKRNNPDHEENDGNGEHRQANGDKRERR